jgi:uncharacterized coiled-coil protein SlyX
MRRSATFALVAVIVLLLGATGVLVQKYRKASADLVQTRADENAARTQSAEAFGAIAEIQDSLNAITAGEGSVRLRSQGLQAEQGLSGPNRREALESIAQLNASIRRTKDKIGQLESRLKKSGTRIAGLEKMISNLKQTVTEKEAQVTQLTGQVESLQTRVAGLETTVEQDQQTIEAKRRELGTIYYIIGKKKDLATSGVIVAKGGVLGMGRTLQLSGRYNETLFTALDTDQETVVRAPAAKLNQVRVLSPQPVSSYELTLEGDRVALRILNPLEFRKFKHLVIMTT